VVGLEGTFLGNAEVVRLDIGELRELNTELAKMGSSDFLIELLGQDVDTNGPGLGVGPQSELSKNLVGEGVGHDERRVASSTTKVDKTTLSKENDVVTVLHGETINLGLDVLNRSGVGLEPGDIDFNIEVTNVADNSIILHGLEVLTNNDITAASGGNEDVSLTNSSLHGGDFETFHSSLKSVDGIDFGDDNTGTEGSESSSATLTDITVTGNNGDLTSNHNIGGTLDTIEKGFTATVQVIELGLGDGVVDVDGRKLQGTVLHHLVKVVDTSGGLLGETLDTSEQLRVLLVDNVGKITTIIKNHVEGLSIREEQSLLDTPDEFLISLTLPGVDRDTSGSDGSSGVILGGEDVAGRPGNISTESSEGLNENSGLLKGYTIKTRLSVPNFHNIITMIVWKKHLRWSCASNQQCGHP
jgi:hypothetical protein